MGIEFKIAGNRRSWTASSPLQLGSGPGGPLQTGVRGFGAVYMGVEGAAYVNWR